ncbi:MAG: hypothetical protein ACTTJ7_03550 [Treponema sp.]
MDFVREYGLVEKTIYGWKQRYGTPKIFKVLRNEGETASLKIIQRRMTAAVLILSVIKQSVPVMVVKVLNCAVGFALIFYGIKRLIKKTV